MSEIDMENVRRLDGRLLLVFRELLATRSATATAERLGLSQSAVSHSLARLRQLHGDPLFIRLPHGLRPTRRAEELAPHVDALVEMASGLYGDPAPFDPETSEQRFSIAAPEFVSATIGSVLLRRWSTRAPSISLTMRQMDEPAVVEALAAGDLDLAIGRFSGRQPASVEQEALYRDEYCVVARRHHPTIEGTVDLDTYLGVGHVIAASSSESAPGESVPGAIRVAAVVPAWLTALTIVSASNAVATCPRRLAEHHAPALRLQVMPVPGRSPSIDVSMLRRSRTPTAAAEWLWSEVRAAVDTT